MSSTLPVPTEIVDIIVNILIKEDWRLLKTCSLVCRTFLHVCRRHLFSTITISRRRLTPATFTQLLSAYPYIVNHVRKLEYCIPAYPQFNEATMATLPRLLRTLERLQRLDISSVDRAEGSLDWANLESSMRTALLELMRLPTLTELRIGNIQNFPMSNLDRCITVTQLNVYGFTTTHAAEEWLLPSQHSPLRQSAFTGSKPRVANLQVGRRTLPALKSLGLTIANQNDIAFASSFANHIAGLERLDLSVNCTIHSSDHPEYSSYESPMSLLELGSFGFIASNSHTLKTIILNFNIDDDNGHWNDPLFGLCDELEAMSAKDVLESLVIKVKFGLEAECNTSEGPWEQLGSILSRPEWSALQVVSLSFKVLYEGRPRNGNGFDLGELHDLLNDLSNIETLQFLFAVEQQQSGLRALFWT
ncbi:hypothetical protein B0H34DRAFT_801670 [Crassisporium funariophilum]|nr:hypothetical protein B0H34DRAFT_801670 [Crassisporium funariophilum]